MGVRFTVLASGSAGNATFVQADGFGLLIDIGLGPRHLASRLASTGASWRSVHAVILTHTHSDHWKERTLAHLRSLKIPLYCHPGHQAVLEICSSSFRDLRAAGLVRSIERNEVCKPAPHVHCLPVEVPHDSDPTFAFRLDGSPGLFGPSWSAGYASDLGTVPPALVEAFRNVDLLAIEFNHDEAMERRSGRPWFLVQRVLSDKGHLSNNQGSAAVRAVVVASDAGMLRHVIQLHLSRDCNLPRLAAAEGRQALDACGSAAGLFTAGQDRVTKSLELDPARRRVSRRAAPTPRPGSLPTRGDASS